MVELIKSHKIMEEQKEHVSNLLEDSWFFGNSLLSSKPSSTMMVRCNSDPCPFLGTNEETNLVPQDHPSKGSNLLRTPSLPSCFDINTKYEEQEEEKEEEDEPRMGDLIRKAMPMSHRILGRMPSLPSFRGKEGFNMVPNIQAEYDGVERLTRRTYTNSLVLLAEKGDIKMVESRKKSVSIYSSMVLPPRYTTKGTKQNANSKNRPHRKQEPTTITGPLKTQTMSQNLDKSKAQKSLSDLEIEELQGFKDLGFSFEPNQVSPSVAQILPALRRNGSLDSNFDNGKLITRPYLSEAWETPWALPLWAEQKPQSTEDMKAQIKLWARNVASNVRPAR